jgi:hypothetical protein
MTTPSAKTKSPRGSSGRDDNRADEQIVDSVAYQETTADCESPDIPTPAPVSESEPEGAVAADDSVDREPFVPPTPILSESDRKLATRMTKAISDRLGLSGRTRSVRV